MTWVTRRLPVLVGLGLAACSAPAPGASPAAAPPPAVAFLNGNSAGGSGAAAAEPEPRTLPELLAGIEAAYRKGDYDRGLALVKRVFELERADVSAFDRVGSIYYVLGRYGEALAIWQRALPLEKNLRRRRGLERSIAVARRTLGLAEGPPPAAPRRAPAARLRRAARSRAVIDGLYKMGVKHYARGEYLQATMAFLRVAELDPGNVQAAKALERLHLEGASPPARAP